MIDAEKLVQLARGGFVREVHHSQSEQRSAFKRHVALYHDTVNRRVSIALRVIWHLRQRGVVIRESAFAHDVRREDLLRRVSGEKIILANTLVLLEEYDLLRHHESVMRRRLVELARSHEMIHRFRQLPGIDWIRAATFFVYLDTPFRFKTRQRLWKYIGVGLERRQSGMSGGRLRVPRQCNKPLKDMILGAAKSAAGMSDHNPFAEQNRRLIHEKMLRPHVARRTVARSMAATMWGMWKSQSDYRPSLVGVPARELVMTEGFRTS
jgi:transposase